MKQEKLEKLPKYSDIEKLVFNIPKTGIVTIGGEEISDDLLLTLRDDALFFQKSRLWEVLNASAANESVNLALIQSKDFDHVQFAKALWHWSSFMCKVVNRLAVKS